MGLIKSGLKAAVAVKVGHMVHDRIQQRQQTTWPAEGSSASMPAAAGPPQASTPGPMGDTLAQLNQLGELKASGVLTDAEFEAQKARILSG